MNWTEFSTGKLHQYFDMALDKIIYFAPRLVLAIVILWIGFKLIKRLRKIIDTALAKLGTTDTLRPFVSSIINVLLKIVLFMLVANIIGANITGLVAVMATASFAVGLALQGSLGNFASGVLILTFRPYKKGDWISINDKFGKVKEIGIFNTKLETPGHNLLIVPNSKITDSVVTNFSNKGVLRLELSVNIPYSESYPKVEQLIKEVLAKLPIVLPSPDPEVGILEFDSHSIEISVRPYVNPNAHWQGRYDVLAAIKKAFHTHGIQMAYSEGVEYGAIGE